MPEKKQGTQLPETRKNSGQAMNSRELYEQGNDYRRQGNWQEAINSYIQAIELDPDSPAVEAKAMLDDILNYYHKDAYNP